MNPPPPRPLTPRRRTAWPLAALLLPFVSPTALCAQLLGEPWVRHTIDRSSRGADGVKLDDADGDGRPDVVTGWEEGGTVRLYLNPGPGRVTSRWPVVRVGEVRSPEDAVPVDLDGDGAVDIVTASEGSTRAIFFHWAPPGAGRYADARAWSTHRLAAAPAGQRWMQILPMDVDGRHGVDLVVGSRGDSAVVGWLESPADPRDLAGWRFRPLTPAGWIMSLRASDLDRDGDADLVVSDRRGPRRGVYWLENPGSAANRMGGAWQRHPIGAMDREVMFLDLLDPVGPAPTVVVAAKPTEILVLRPEGAPRARWREERFRLDPAGIGTAKAVRVADLDLDGRPDMVFSFEEAVGARSGVAWAPLLAGSPALAGPLRDIAGPEGVKYDLIELVDLDADGDLDLLTTEEVDGLGVVWYENPTR